MVTAPMSSTKQPQIPVVINKKKLTSSHPLIPELRNSEIKHFRVHGILKTDWRYVECAKETHVLAVFRQLRTGED
jgi:hypothetical protein